MAVRLMQAPLPWLPEGATEIAPGVGLVSGDDGSGTVWVHGMATFCWEAGDEARYPLAGLLLALPALEQAGLLAVARQVYGRIRNGFYGLELVLAACVFLALLREPRAEGATRVSPAALGRVLGLDRAPEVKTLRRKLRELAAAGKADGLQLAIAARHAATRPGELGLLYIDGHTRAYSGTRDVQKMHLGRLGRPGPGTEEVGKHPSPPGKGGPR